MVAGKKIVLGITGSIAAYKVPLLVRLLVKSGADVKVMMTPAAVDFVTPLTLSTLSGKPVLIEPFDPADGSWNNHVELGNWADLFVLAPVSANTLAKMAAGVADNFFLTAYLSAKCPVMFAPAMDLDMFRHPTTQRNIETLLGFGNILIEPATGELASGLSGPGRMEEPEEIFNMITRHFEEHRVFEGKRFLITAGPTREAIDPVRYIGNHSSGKMGFALAEACAGRGGEVTLVTGPVNINVSNPGIERIDVVSSDEMYAECMKVFPGADVIIMSAAVSDFRPGSPEKQKIKKAKGLESIELQPTRDILKSLGDIKKSGQVLVGFALETENEEENALKKLKSKNLDLVIMNSLNDEGAGFGSDQNKITIFEQDGKKTSFELKDKAEVAVDILDIIKKKI
jgi:phosphopantothenoylcysteine decarboxylase/phosphopantothenate--cysteine ligase